MNPQLLIKKILLFPLTKIILSAIFLLVVYNFFNKFGGGIFKSDIISREWNGLFTVVISLILVLLAYALLFRIYEKRQITELALSNFGKNFFLGVCIGAVLQSLTILVIYLTGGYHVLSTNTGILFILPSLIMALSSSVMEELLFRGIIFRILEEKLGSYAALIISALLFGIIHILNPNSSLFAGISLVIQAGLLLGVSYIFSRSLWLPIGIHFAWNFTQSAIYGATVSGNKISKSLITSDISGNELITGGSFGPESSIQATVLCLIATIILLILSKQKKNIIKPFWYKISNQAELK